MVDYALEERFKSYLLFGEDEIDLKLEISKDKPNPSVTELDFKLLMQEYLLFGEENDTNDINYGSHTKFSTPNLNKENQRGRI